VTAGTDLVRTGAGDLLSTDGGALQWLGQPVGPTPALGVWSSVDVWVTPDAGTATLRWNGQSGVTLPLPAAWGTADLSPLMLGPSSAGGPIRGVYTPVDLIPH
jgi:hypothetical protein